MTYLNKVWVPLVVALTLTIGLASPASAAASIPRYYGTDRVQTALAVERQFPSSVPAVVLATTANYADALACGPLAARWRAPLLLTPSTGLDSSVASAMRSAVPLGVPVFLCGGTGALSVDVETMVRGLGYTQIYRFAGRDRAETASLVAQASRNSQGVYNHQVMVIADGQNYEEALIGAYIAGSQNGVLLLSNGSQLPDSTRAFLNQFTNLPLYAVGRLASQAVSGYRITQTFDQPAGVVNTAVEVAQKFCGNCATVVVVSRADWPDAMAAVPYAVMRGGSVVFTERSFLPAVVDDHLRRRRHVVTATPIVGGPAAVDPLVENDLNKASNL